jgi:FtsP/CotA-like multicopper oxidase with cupredoxin domain
MRNRLTFSTFAVVLAFVAGACSGGGSTAAGGAGEQAAGEPAMVQVTLSDFAITPSTLNVPAEQPLMFDVENQGQTPHTFAVTVGAKTYDSGNIGVGGLVTLQVPALTAGSYEAFCSVTGHSDLGMVATVVAGSSTTTVGSDGATATDRSTMTAEQMADMHQAGVDAFLAGEQTSIHGGQPLEYTNDHGVKVFELWAEPVQWEISKGVFKSAMTFNGTVPGPEIRVNPGDRVQVVVQNQLDQPTAVHFHGLTVPNEADGVPFVTQPPIMPGDGWTYEFTVKDPPGMYVYHSHFNSTEQVGSGLYGAFIVEPKTGWKSVYGVRPAEEYSIFLGDGPLDYVLNGKSFPATLPLVADLGDWVLIHMANDGSLLHPMHLHGFHFQVVGEDGFPLATQNRYMADTLVVAPGARFDILVKADQPGAWAFHCHILPHVEGPQGMFGMVTALVVQ